MSFNKGYIVHRRYEIIDLIGQGGMSDVYKAIDLGQSRQEVVVKHLILPRKAQHIRDLLYSFEQEFKILSSLNHPGIPKVFEFVTENNDFFLIEEFIDGKLLSGMLVGMKPHKAVKYILQVCDLFEYLHKHDIIYRDLKPDNIIIDKNEELHLIDFGISRVFSPAKKDDTIALGTPGYASPEAYNTDQTDERSDIFTMCVLLHQMLTGVDPTLIPFKFENPHKLDSKIPQDISDVIMKGLDLKIDNRHKNIEEFREAIFKTSSYKKKFKSYRKRIDKRDKFVSKEDPVSEFSKFRLSLIKPKPQDVIAGLAVSVILGLMTFFIVRMHVGFPGSLLLPFLVFLFVNGVFFASGQIRREGMKSVKIYKSGLLYEGYDTSFTVLWDDVYAVKYDFSGLKKKVTIVTLNGDFDFDDKLEGWDQLMKEVQRRADMKLRHDISGRLPEMEVFEKQ